MWRLYRGTHSCVRRLACQWRQRLNPLTHPDRDDVEAEYVADMVGVILGVHVAIVPWHALLRAPSALPMAQAAHPAHVCVLEPGRPGSSTGAPCPVLQLLRGSWQTEGDTRDAGEGHGLLLGLEELVCL